MKLTRLAILVIFIGLLMVPVSAGTKYMSGDPELTASISGTNEFSAGDDATISVFIENRGLIDIKFVHSDIVERDDLPNTAKLIRATLQPGTAPLTIKSDSQMVGDIKGGDRVLVPFTAKIDAGAAAGTYLLPLTLEYTYLREAEQYGQDSITYTYREVNETIDLPVTIRPEAFLTIEDLSTEHLHAGNEGYLTMRIHNSGFVDAASAVLKIARNGNSPVIPTESSVYIGEFPANGTVETRFKVSVSREAGEQKYPLEVFLVYKDQSGDTITSDVLTIGVPVQGKIEFMVTGNPESLKTGEKGVIEVEYQNTGAATAYNAQARISAVDPFTSNDDTAFLGDLQPGQTAVARYEVSVDESATPKEYGLDSEIRYRDALGNSQISDTLKVKITIEESSILLPVIAGVLLLLGVSGAAYYFIRMKKKS